MKQVLAVPRYGGGQPLYLQKPNWLLRGILIVSIGLHTILFFHLERIYRSQNISMIELSLRDESTLPQRAIPRPRRRPPDNQQPPDTVKPISARPSPPSIKPIQMTPVMSSLPDGIAESITDTMGINAQATDASAWAPVALPDFSTETFDSPNSYLEMVRFRIEKNKRYPEKAKQRNMRGRVIVSLLITLEGEIESIAIKKSSGHAILDDAALSAVKRAVPFPAPPAQFFKKDILLNVPILFEIT